MRKFYLGLAVRKDSLERKQQVYDSTYTDVYYLHVISRKTFSINSAFCELYETDKFITNKWEDLHFR